MSKGKVSASNRIDGVLIGVLAATNSAGEPLVAYSGNESELPAVAKTTVAVDSNAIGREVALLFEGGDNTKPIIVGLIHNESLSPVSKASPETTDDREISIGKWTPDEDTQELTVDGERVQLSAKREIVLKCGKASITMTRAGKVIIRGTYISTRSSGVNRIKGGSVQIN